jgi:hypothetical protein
MSNPFQFSDLEELKMFGNKVKNMSIASLKGHLPRGH